MAYKMTFRHATSLILLTTLLFTPNASAADWLYTIRPGDTFWDLCIKYTKVNNCWQTLPDLNNVTRTRQLPPGYIIKIPVAWLKQEPEPVTVGFIRGEVLAKATNADQPIALQGGEKLTIGTVIITGEGLVTLEFGDGSNMQLEPQSELVLDALSSFDGTGIVDSQVRLNRGAVKTRVIKRDPPSNFEITTPSAVAAVRGTEYRISSVDTSPPTMRGEVFEGLIDVSTNEASKDVAAGFGIIVEKGSVLPDPQPLLTEPQLIDYESAQFLPASIGWNPIDNVSHYLIDIVKDNKKEKLALRSTTKDNRFIITELKQGCYRLKLRGVDQQQLHGMATNESLCIAPELAAPQLESSNLKAKLKHQYTLAWKPVPQAKSYKVQRARDLHFTEIIEERIVNEAEFQWSDEQVGYVRVLSIGQEDQKTQYSEALKWQSQQRSGWKPFITFVAFLLIAL